MKSKVTIRMGAAYHDCTINAPTGVLHFDFRKMSKDDKRVFHREFMNAFRQGYYGNAA